MDTKRVSSQYIHKGKSMKLKLINTPNFDLWYIRLSKNCVMCFYFYTIKHFSFWGYKWFDCFSNGANGRQVTGLVLPLLYIQLVTPIPLIWVTENDLIQFSLNTFKERLNDINDCFAEYLLSESNEISKTEFADKNTESSILYQLINFYENHLK
jgi:hypothetical protein